MMFLLKREKKSKMTAKAQGMKFLSEKGQRINWQKNLKKYYTE